MKYYYLLFLVLFSYYYNFSQNLQSPDLCLVTVNNHGKVELKWRYSDTSLIDGYIIKRKIFDGVGVVEGTMNNIEVINNSTISNYVDISQSYSTYSNPNMRSEEYRISAFVYRNDSLILSNMTSFQKTVFLSIEWDRCDKKAIIKWTKYVNRDVSKYNILVSSDSINFTKLSENSIDDTTLEILHIELLNTFYFKIETITNIENPCLSDTSYSNVVKLFTETPFSPDTLLIYNISTIDNKKIEINLITSKSTHDNIYILNKIKESEIAQIAEFSPINQIISYYDISDAFLNYEYYLTAKNKNCEEILNKSLNIDNIVLEVTQNRSELFFVWNSTLIFEKEIEKYNIYLKQDNIWKIILEVEGTQKQAQISLFDIRNFNFEEYENTNFEFKIEAIPTYNPINKIVTSFSNVYILPLKTILAIPTVFKPNSQNVENKLFTIKALFIKDFEVSIFSQNGTLLFSSNDINISWDGKNKKGEFVPQDLYIFQIKYIDFSNKISVIDGIVQLIW